MDAPESSAKSTWKRVGVVFLIVFTCAALLLGARIARSGSSVAESIHIKAPLWAAIARSSGIAIIAVWWLFAVAAIAASILVMRGAWDRRFSRIEIVCSILLVVAFILAASGFEPIWTLSRLG
jgi:hypothetical protein